jgi:hypothetical protein
VSDSVGQAPLDRPVTDVCRMGWEASGTRGIDIPMGGLHHRCADACFPGSWFEARRLMLYTFLRLLFTAFFCV